MAKDYETFADRIEKYACPPVPLGFSRVELRALHAFKREFAGAFRELYKTLPAEKADEFIGRLLKQLGEQG